MIPLINQYSQWGRSEVVIIYPDSMLFGGMVYPRPNSTPPKISQNQHDDSAMSGWGLEDVGSSSRSNQRQVSLRCELLIGWYH